ncbi:MAG: ORF6N domain-containing protein [Desulfobacteraceae bacterium]|nr:ORF6N domain-containing protein [Desulfobacteraceae bacterium]
MTSIVPTESIVNKIVFLRGEKVLLDHDLAELYGVETKVLKQAVRRNIKRFPDDFMFELTKEENQSLRSQNVTLPAKPRKKIGFEVKEKQAAYGRRGVKRKKAKHA